MPFVIVEGSDNITKESKRKLIEDISKITANAYSLPVESISVLIHENPTDNVGVGGKQLTEQLKH